MLRFPLFLALVLLFAACGDDATDVADAASTTSIAPATAPSKPVAEPDFFTFVPGRRFGKISKFTTGGQMSELYGDDVEPTTDIQLGEGTRTGGYLLYPGTKNQAEIMLPDEGSGISRLTVRIAGKDSDWRLAGSELRIGTTLAELEEMNGKPFELSGYEWDNGGTVTDWKGGKLKDIGVVTSYGGGGSGSRGIDRSVIGDQLISSDNPALDTIGVTVSSVSIVFR